MQGNAFPAWMQAGIKTCAAGHSRYGGPDECPTCSGSKPTDEKRIAEVRTAGWHEQNRISWRHSLIPQGQRAE